MKRDPRLVPLSREHHAALRLGRQLIAGEGGGRLRDMLPAVRAHFADDEQLVGFLKSGSENGRLYGLNGQGSGRMPGFGSLLTDEQIREIVEYVRSL